MTLIIEELKSDNIFLDRMYQQLNIIYMFLLFINPCPGGSNIRK